MTQPTTFRAPLYPPISRTTALEASTTRAQQVDALISKIPLTPTYYTLQSTFSQSPAPPIHAKNWNNTWSQTPPVTTAEPTTYNNDSSMAISSANDRLARSAGANPSSPRIHIRFWTPVPALCNDSTTTTATTTPSSSTTTTTTTSSSPTPKLISSTNSTPTQEDPYYINHQGCATYLKPLELKALSEKEIQSIAQPLKESRAFLSSCDSLRKEQLHQHAQALLAGLKRRVYYVTGGRPMSEFYSFYVKNFIELVISWATSSWTQEKKWFPQVAAQQLFQTHLETILREYLQELNSRGLFPQSVLENLNLNLYEEADELLPLNPQIGNQRSLPPRTYNPAPNYPPGEDLTDNNPYFFRG